MVYLTSIQDTFKHAIILNVFPNLSLLVLGIAWYLIMRVIRSQVRDILLFRRFFLVTGAAKRGINISQFKPLKSLRRLKFSKLQFGWGLILGHEVDFFYSELWKGQLLLHCNPSWPRPSTTHICKTRPELYFEIINLVRSIVLMGDVSGVGFGNNSVQRDLYVSFKLTFLSSMINVTM